jgi:1-acyl-sn-glycerol-3-phosphate acyltransferase
MTEIPQAVAPQLIDVEKAFASKNPKLLEQIPGFIIRYLKRIVHQDEINAFIASQAGVVGMEFVYQTIRYFDFHAEAVGLENVPKDSRLIFAANHPLGGLDSLCLLHIIHQHIQPNPKILANDLLMNVKPLRNVMIGVNKHGGNSREYVAEMHRVFQGDEPVVFFPAGLVSRRSWGRIEDLEWKSTFVKKAFLNERDVIPVHISGRVSGFFYRLANLRKLLGIKANIEMLYLPDEMFKQKGVRLVIHFGKPIPWRSFDSSQSPEYWAETVKKHVYHMVGTA